MAVGLCVVLFYGHALFVDVLLVLVAAAVVAAVCIVCVLLLLLLLLLLLVLLLLLLLLVCLFLLLRLLMLLWCCFCGSCCSCCCCWCCCCGCIFNTSILRKLSPQIISFLPPFLLFYWCTVCTLHFSFKLCSTWNVCHTQIWWKFKTSKSEFPTTRDLSQHTSISCHSCLHTPKTWKYSVCIHSASGQVRCAWWAAEEMMPQNQTRARHWQLSHDILTIWLHLIAPYKYHATKLS